jgi:hypothetical protein
MSKREQEAIIKTTLESFTGNIDSKIKSKLDSLTDGKDAVISDELIGKVAGMAAGLVEVPDVAAVITSSPESIRDALELFMDDSEKMKMDSIGGLTDKIQEIERALLTQSSMPAGGISKNAVLSLIAENAGAGSGDMEASTYDPNTVAGDVFARANHTGVEAITVADTDNVVGLTVTQNDTTNNPIAATIVNTGTGSGIQLEQDGDGIGMSIVSDATTKRALNVYSNAITSSSLGLARFNIDNASATADVISVINDGTGDGIKIDQNGNGTALNIDSEATTSPAVTIDIVDGDAHLRLVGDSGNATPTEGDFWRESDGLKYYDGTTEKNLLNSPDKTGAETISGDWVFENTSGNTYVEIQKVTSTDQAAFKMNNEAGNTRFIAGLTSLADDDFFIGRYNESGVFQESSIYIDGVTGVLTFGASSVVLGELSATAINVSGDTSAGDDAAVGYTATEGIVITGQGSTNDVTIKNDVDTAVIEIPTGTTNVDIAGALSIGGELDAGANSIGFTMQTATGDGTTTVDWKLGNHFDFTFGAFNETFTFTAPTKPGVYTMSLKQDSVGSRTATWPATVKWPAGTAPTLTTTATTGYDVCSFRFDGTNFYAVSTLNFS